MDEIDKKIEKMEKGQPVVDTQGHFMYYVENTTEIKWLINQLKECREENNALRIVNEALDNFNKAIEQRTKDECYFEISKLIKNRLIGKGEKYLSANCSDIYALIQRTLGALKSIDSAEVKPSGDSA